MQNIIFTGEVSISLKTSAGQSFVSRPAGFPHDPPPPKELFFRLELRQACVTEGVCCVVSRVSLPTAPWEMDNIIPVVDVDNKLEG